MNTLNSDSKAKTQVRSACSTQRKAILGGTFDPIHFGHIKPAEAIAQWLQIEHIHLLPAHIPPHKNRTYATATQRLAMVNLVCQHLPLFSCDDRELTRGSPSYTIDTLREIKAQNPQQQLFFIIGMDSLVNFSSWHQWQQILDFCHLVVNSRPQYQLDDLNSDIKALVEQHQASHLRDVEGCAAGRIFIHHNQQHPISSTAIRTAISQQQYLAEQLPEFIADYIHQQQLYG